MWQSRYARDPAVLNRLIEIDGTPARVVGVLPRDFELPSLHAADVLFPLALDEAAQRRMSPGAPVRAFARLKPGVSMVQAREQLEPLFQDAQKIIPAGFRKEFHLKVRSLRDRQMAEVRPIAWVLVGAVVAVLLIACANVASLLMARGAARQRELEVRSALGASRGRLVRQGLTESMLLSFAGAMLGWLLAEGLLWMFVAIAPAGVAFLEKATLDLRMIAFTAGTSLVCGLMFGLIPALERPGLQLLTGRTLTQPAYAGVRQWLVAAQIAMSLVLLTAATLFLRSFHNLESQQLGMRADNTLTLSVTVGRHNYPTAETEMAFFRRLEERLKFGPGVSMVAVSDSLPPAANHNSRRLDSILVSGKPPATNGGGLVTFRWVSPEYFRVLDIPIVQGEGLREEERESSESFVVLSRTLAARLFPGGGAVGQRILLNGLESRGAVTSRRDNRVSEQWANVVGVAADVKNGGLSGEQQPEYYRLRRYRGEDWDGSGVWDRSAVVVLRSSVPARTLADWMREQMAAMDATLPIDIATLHERIGKLADQPRFQTVLVGFFAATGLAMAMIGLYGVIAFLVTQREREIGVRIALGASRGRVLKMVITKSLRLMVYGTVAGLVAALAFSRFLTSLLYSVGPHDPLSYGFVVAMLVATGLMASLIPARSATQVDPATVLRSE